MVQRIEPDVEAYGVDDACLTRPVNEVGPVCGRERQRFLADHVLASGQTRVNLVGVDIVRARDVNDVDVWGGGEGLHVFVDRWQVGSLCLRSGSLRRGPDYPDNVDADAPKRLDMGEAYETNTNNACA